MRRFAPSDVITRRRSAAGLKSTTRDGALQRLGDLALHRGGAGLGVDRVDAAVGGHRVQHAVGRTHVDADDVRRALDVGLAGDFLASPDRPSPASCRRPDRRSRPHWRRCARNGAARIVPASASVFSRFSWISPVADCRLACGKIGPERPAVPVHARDTGRIAARLQEHAAIRRRRSRLRERPNARASSPSAAAAGPSRDPSRASSRSRACRAASCPWRARARPWRGPCR